MNDELKRIKAKDYSKIDQTLFENMARTDNLSSTLSQLGQFQKYLMQQIAHLNNQPQKENQTLKSSINKNFDTLRESLVQCSKLKKENKSKSTIKQRLVEVQDKYLQLKQEVREQIGHACNEATKQVEKTMKQVIRVLEKEKSQKQELLEKIQILKKEKEILNLQNQQLKKQQNEVQINSFRSVSNQEQDQKKKDSHHRSTILQRNESLQLQSAKTQGDPLQEKINNYGSNGLNSIPSFSEKTWKIKREEIIKNDAGIQPKRYSLSRQTSNHRLSSKENIHFSKQNEALLSKGVREERRKSKQKIKIFSLI